MIKNYALTILFSFSLFHLSHGEIYGVLNNLASGTGSLNQAILDANGHAGKDTILFNIPFPGVSARTITVNSTNPLPIVTDALLIDATSQVAGDEFGVSTAKIQLTSTDYTANGLVLNADSCEVYGLYINHFETGLKILGGDFKIGAVGDGNVINDCSEVCLKISDITAGYVLATLVGIDTSGEEGVSPNAIGISIESSKKVTIGGKQPGARNFVSGNDIGIKLSDCKFIDIQGNFVGMDASGYFPAPNNTGIQIVMSSNNINIGGDSTKERNVISGNLEHGIDAEMYSSFIQGNLIGTDATATYPAGNGEYGIYVRDLSHDNLIGGLTEGTGNEIAYSGKEAIFFQNSGVKNISIRGNRMYCNSQSSGNGGIVTNGGNQELAPPSLVIVSSNFITGTSAPGLEVDLYSADSCGKCEGSEYLITIIPDESGVFSISLTVNGKVTATSNDSLGNTSEFAICKDSATATCIFASFLVSDDKVCSSTLIDFTDQTISVPGSTVTSWNWNFGDGATSTDQNPSHSYLLSGFYTVQMIVENSESCTDTIDHEIQVTEGVVADFTAPIGVCLGEPAHFVDQSVPQGTTFITSWNWDLGDGTLSNFTDFEHTYTATGDYDVKLEVLNSNGCSNIIIKTIHVSEAPIADFSVIAEACSEDPVQFTDLSTAGSGSTVTGWFWDFGDGGTSTSQNASHLFATSGTYTVELIVTNNFGCSNSTEQEIEIISGPIASFTYIASGQSIIFQNNSAVNDDYSVLWSFGDGTTSTLSNPVHTYSLDGAYEVCLIIVDSVCELNDTTCQTILVTGLEDLLSQNSILIEPNPAIDRINVSSLSAVIQINTIRLLNPLGEQVCKWLPDNASASSLALSIPPMPFGLYLLQVETNHGVLMKKIILSTR